MMKNILSKITAVIIASVSFASCTDVDICTSELHPHYATVELNYKWNNVQMEDSMVVVAYRLMSDWCCAYMTTPDGAAGHYLNNRPDTVFENIVGEELFTVKSGELRFLTYNYDANNNGFDYVNAFSDSAICNRNISLEYKEYKLSDAIIKENAIENFKSLNSSNSKYVLNGDIIEPIYTQYTDIMDIESGANVVEFAPKSILNNYEFKFDIYAKDVTINNVVAEITGIPYKYNLVEEKPYTDKLLKVLFGVKSYGSSAFRGNAIVTGIMRSASAVNYSGTGVLQLAIDVTDAEGNDKVYNLLMNLYNYMPGHERLLYGNDFLFDIDAPIIISNEGVDVSAASSNGTMWRYVK